MYKRQEEWTIERLCQEVNLEKSQFYVYYHHFFSTCLLYTSNPGLQRGIHPAMEAALDFCVNFTLDKTFHMTGYLHPAPDFPCIVFGQIDGKSCFFYNKVAEQQNLGKHKQNKDNGY